MNQFTLYIKHTAAKGGNYSLRETWHLEEMLSNQNPFKTITFIYEMYFSNKNMRMYEIRLKKNGNVNYVGSANILFHVKFTLTNKNARIWTATIMYLKRRECKRKPINLKYTHWKLKRERPSRATCFLVFNQAGQAQCYIWQTKQSNKAPMV